MKYLSIFLAVGTAATAMAIAVTVVSITMDTIPKVRSIRAGVKACMADIVAKAKLDNPIVGARIAQKLADHAKRAVGLIEISTATLSALKNDGAIGLRERFLQILADAKDAVTPDVQELSPETRQQIKNSFRSAVADWKNQAAEVYNVLGININLLPTIENVLGLSQIALVNLRARELNGEAEAVEGCNEIPA